MAKTSLGLHLTRPASLLGPFDSEGALTEKFNVI